MDKITELCTGCRACEQSCSKNAIDMKPNAEGFLTAIIDQGKCVDCKMCINTCPQNKIPDSLMPKNVYAAKSCDSSLLKKSASGGIFASIATFFLENKGVVYGVKYDANWTAVHERVDNLTDLAPLLSSKYVQADTRDSYAKVKRDLLDGKKVLFSGTGCQVAGLKSFLRKDYSNLFTIDIVCHGVTSPELFKKYIHWKEKKEHGKISFFDFRSKEISWGLDYTYVINGKKKTESNTIDPYYYFFLKGFAYRECCYSCKYSNPRRCGDITICDYWGIEHEHPSFNARNGASAVLMNSDKGCDLWQQVSTHFNCYESSFEQVSKYNSNLLSPTKRVDSYRDKIYDGIMDDSDGKWFDIFASKHKPTTKARIKHLIPNCVLKMIKSLKI